MPLFLDNPAPMIFLLTNNLTAASYEQGLKDRLLQQKLFSYIGAGIKSPIF